MTLARSLLAAGTLLMALGAPAAAQDEPAGAPDTPVVLAPDTVGTPDERAEAMLAQMTLDEKLTLLEGYFASPFAGFPGSSAEPYEPPLEARRGSAGYVPGIPRLGIPPQWETDAAIGVASQNGATIRNRARPCPRSSPPRRLGIRRWPMPAGR